MAKKILSKIPYTLLFGILYKYAYIFMSIFIKDLSIHPIEDFSLCSNVLILIPANAFAILCGAGITILFHHLEQRIKISTTAECIRISALSFILFVFLLSYRLYSITLYYETYKSYESWSITILCTIISLLVLTIYFYYNEIAKNTTKEWYSVIRKMQREIDAENDIINDEIALLKSIETKIESYSEIIESAPDIPDDINVYYNEIKESYNSLMQKVPK